MCNKAFIFDVQRFTIVNGPGIRTAVFFKGCPLSCKWCHNPESQIPLPQLLYIKSKCTGCGKCIRVCKNNAHRISDQGHSINFNKCTVCGICANVCPNGALLISGKELNLIELIDVILSDKVYYDLSNGGVTFTGGEPTLYDECVIKLCKEIKKESIHIVIDTCGYAPLEVFKKLAPLCDLFLYDIKLMDSKKHREYTGVPNDLILENLNWLANSGSNIRIRVPLIPGVNDNEENIRETARFITGLRIDELDLLPYHEYGRSKALGIGRDEADIFEKPDLAKIDSVIVKYKQYGVKACL